MPKEYIREDDLSEFLSRQRDKHPIALKLHLELDLEGCSVQDMRILHKYGLPVFDDVGGVGGYIDFLTTIQRSEDKLVSGQAHLDGLDGQSNHRISFDEIILYRLIAFSLLR